MTSSLISDSQPKMKTGGYVLLILGSLMLLSYFAPPIAVEAKIAGSDFGFTVISDVGLIVGALAVTLGFALLILGRRRSKLKKVTSHFSGDHDGA